MKHSACLDWKCFCYCCELEGSSHHSYVAVSTKLNCCRCTFKCEELFTVSLKQTNSSPDHVLITFGSHSGAPGSQMRYTPCLLTHLLGESDLDGQSMYNVHVCEFFFMRVCLLEGESCWREREVQNAETSLCW